MPLVGHGGRSCVDLEALEEQDSSLAGCIDIGPAGGLFDLQHRGHGIDFLALLDRNRDSGRHQPLPTLATVAEKEVNGA